MEKFSTISRKRSKMGNPYYPKDEEVSSCGNSRKGCEFSQTVRYLIREESKKLYGIIKCMIPDCTVWHSLEVHHIRPPWAGGRGNQENGIALCPIHHSWADKGYITPLELQKYKEGRIELFSSINSQQDVQKIIEDSALSNTVINSPPKAYSYYSRRLNLLSRCFSIPLTESMQQRVLLKIAKTQLDLAGGLTSWEQSNLIPKNKLNRYQINILASSAANIAKKISDRFTLLHAYHVHAVNSNATGAFNTSLDYCSQICEIYPDIKDIDTNYAAYLTRNISTIYAKIGHRTKAKELIKRSKKYSENEAETWMREAQNLMIWGNLKHAEKRMQQYLSLPAKDIECLSPSQKAISYRLQAIFEYLTDNETKGIELLEKAEIVAVKAELGHQLGKLRHAFLYFSSASFKDVIKNFGLNKLKRGYCPSDILLVV